MNLNLLHTTVRSPTQAYDIFSQYGRFPKQKHAFLIRFILNTGTDIKDLTFVAKSCDRPSISLTTQELSQYNKKRIIYTGYKTNPVNVVFYDTADLAAQTLWMKYSQYYFGDFMQPPSSFNDDIENSSSNWIANLGNYGYGFNANNGGNTSFGSQFFIKYIEIVQFNNSNGYDTYTLINPKLSNFELDDLDYALSDISTVKMSFEYEAVSYCPGSMGASSMSVPELQKGQPFNGNPLDIPSVDLNIPPAYYNNVNGQSFLSDLLGGLLGNATDGALSTPASNYYNGANGNGSGLGIFGNFIFGAGTNEMAKGLSSLTQSINNPALNAVLGLGSATAMGNLPGIGSNFFNVNSGIASAASSNASGSDIITSGLMGSQMLGEGITSSAPSLGGIVNDVETLFATERVTNEVTAPENDQIAGLTLSDSAFGVINTKLNGTSQYGYNPQIYNGNNYGYQGTKGLTQPKPPYGYYNTPSDMNTVPRNRSGFVPTNETGKTIVNANNSGVVDDSALTKSYGNQNNISTSISTFIDPITGITYNF